MCCQRVASLLGVMSLGVIASILPAQTQPNQNGQPEPAPLVNGYQPSAYPETYDYGTGFPVVEVRAVPPAMARAAAARAEFRRAHSTLDLLVLEMKKAFERSRDYVTAMSEERLAWEALEAAKDRALQSVYDDPAYQASVMLRKNLTEQIQDTHERRDVDPGYIRAMAEVKMGYASAASAMEAAALAADPDVQQARERLRRAGARLTEMRQQFDIGLRASPDVLAARRDMADARITKIASVAYLTGVRHARDIALDFAYFTHRYDQYKYLSYGYYGGYSYGYPIGWQYR